MTRHILSNSAMIFLWVVIFISRIQPSYRIPIIQDLFSITFYVMFVWFFIISINEFNKSSKRVKFIYVLLIISEIFLFLSRMIFGDELSYSILRSLMERITLINIFFYGLKRGFWLKLKALSLLLTSYLLINFATVIMYPEGLYENELYTENWFLGYKNVIVRTLLPTLAISLLCSIHKTKKIGLKNIVLSFIAILTVLIVNSSTSIIMLVLFTGSVLFLCINKKNYRYINLREAYLLPLVISIFFIFLGLQSYFQSFFEIFEKDSTLTGRIYAWEFALLKIFQQPIWGYGFHTGDEWRILYGYFSQLGINGIGFSHPHNYYLYMLLQGGICYFILYTFLIFSINRYNKNIINKNAYTYILCIMYFCFFIEGITESITGAPLFIPMLALFIRVNELEDKDIIGIDKISLL